LSVPETGELLSYEQLSIYDSQAAASYYSYAVSERHFGLGPRQAVDVSVEFYPSQKRVEKKSVRGNTTIEIVEEPN